MKTISITVALLISIVPFSEIYSQSTNTMIFTESNALNSTLSSSDTFCQSCGKKNSDSNSYCTGCGAKLGKIESTAPHSDLHGRYNSKITSIASGTSGNTYIGGIMDGKFSAGENYSTGGWFASGLAAGVLLGLIGTGVIAGVSIIGDPDPPDYEMMRIQEMDSRYKAGFLKGYSKKSKSKKLGSSVKGGLIGTATIVAIIIASYSS